MHCAARWFLGLTGLLVAGMAFAHTGAHAGGGFLTGYTHPFMGLDHVLAMGAVGLWAVQLGRRSLLIVPAAFVAAMAAGAAIGAEGIALPQVEGMVALSLLALGLLVAFSVRAAWSWAIPLIAAFAVFHGHAHGTGMPAFAARWEYFAGFLIATATLHALGMGAGAAIKERPAIVRLGGGAVISLCGGWLLLSA